MASKQTRFSVLFLVALVVLPFGSLGTAGGRASVMSGTAGVADLPVVAEHRYTMAAKVRPLLLFWIRRDNVGGARIVWRRDEEGSVAFEMLIGSDPARAPRRINRWGYIAEEVRGSEARVLGVMKQSDEQSIDEAKSRLAREAQERRYVFKAVRATISDDEARTGITTIGLTQDATYRDLDMLLDRVMSESENTVARSARVPSGARSGFLAALAELIHQGVEAHRLPAPAREPARGSTLAYVYNGTLYDLTLRSSEFHREARFGDQRYTNLVRGEFEIRNRAKGRKTRFDLDYGTEGPLAEVPVRILYQPRWWFQVELLLDDDAQF